MGPSLARTSRGRGRRGRITRRWRQGFDTFRDRREAGRLLARRLAGYADRDPVVVGLARGGVPVAFEVASALGTPLDVFVVRKLGVPAQPELGMGAIAEGGARVLNPEVVAEACVTAPELAAVEGRERVELERRAGLYRGGRAAVDLRERLVIVVDDGLATGGTARAAIEGVRRRGARRIVLAVPIAARATLAALAPEVDDIVCVEAPRDLRAVGEWYADFSPTTDDEVLELLEPRLPDAGS
jgi:putative phosphoribosyl transferase